MNKHARLFHRIAPVYRLFFRAQARSYSQLLESYGQHLPPGGALDIGCGTGALSYSLLIKGYEVTGVDFAPGMINQARILCPGVNFSVANGTKLPFPDKSFDLVTAAYVAHGLGTEYRMALYKEAARLSRGLVMFHDYNRRRNLIVDLVECLEGGNYFSFIKRGVPEMKQVFTSVDIIEVGIRSNWYICIP